MFDNAAHLGNVTQDVSGSPTNHHFVGWERSRGGPIRIDFKFDKRKYLDGLRKKKSKESPLVGPSSVSESSLIASV